MSMDFLERLDKVLAEQRTPDVVEELESGQVFVFGTDPDGLHKGGAAALAVSKFGAVPGIGEGLRDRSYAIPVHRHRHERMREAVTRFIMFAKNNPGFVFMVVPVGCGKAGMDVDLVADMFVDAVNLDNIFLPEIFIRSLRRNYRVREDMDLPVRYVDKIVGADVLRGRLMGLMAEISKRTDKPITFDDEILKSDNIMLHAFLRVIHVVRPEEQRVMNALMDEVKRTDVSEQENSEKNSMLRTLEFVKGWKFDAMQKFDEGASIYDLLVFTDRDFARSKNEKESAYGYRGKLPDRKLKVITGNGNLGLADRNGAKVLEYEYDRIEPMGYTGRGWIVRKGNLVGAVNERGEWMFPIEYEDIKVKYEDGHFLKKGGKWGFVSVDGLDKIDIIYDQIENYSSSWSGFKVMKDGKWGYVGAKGNVVVPLQYDSISLCSDSMIKVQSGEKYGFYNLKKNTFTSLKYTYADDYSSAKGGATVVATDKLRGVVDTEDNLIIPMEYDYICIDGPDLYRLKKNGRYGIIDSKGNVIFPFRYRDLGKFDSDGITYAENDEGKYGYVDKNGNAVIGFRYLRADNFERDYAKVSMGHACVGVIDKSGRFVVPPRYRDVFIGYDGVIEVSEGSAYGNLRGIYDLKNDLTLPCLYERIEVRTRNRDGYLECRCYKDLCSAPVDVTLTPLCGEPLPSVPEITDLYILYSEQGQEDSRYVVIRDLRKSYQGEDFKWIRWKMQDGILTLPEEIDGLPVKGLGYGAGSDEFPLRGLIVPKGYKTIGGDAFRANPTLEFVSMPDGVREIESGAFCSCPHLKHVFLGEIRRFIIFPQNPLSALAVHRHTFDDCDPQVTFYIPEKYILDSRYDTIRFPRVEKREGNEPMVIERYRSGIG